VEAFQFLQSRRKALAASQIAAYGYKATRWGDPSHVGLHLRRRTSEPITAAHKDLFVGNVGFAIRNWTFATVNLNDHCGSVPAIPLERQEPARSGPPPEPRARTDCGSERGQSKKRLKPPALNAAITENSEQPVKPKPGKRKLPDCIATGSHSAVSPPAPTLHDRQCREEKKQMCPVEWERSAVPPSPTLGCC
jgi:hypothetical protein